MYEILLNEDPVMQGEYSEALKTLGYHLEETVRFLAFLLPLSFSVRWKVFYAFYVSVLRLGDIPLMTWLTGGGGKRCRSWQWRSRAPCILFPRLNGHTKHPLYRV